MSSDARLKKLERKVASLGKQVERQKRATKALETEVSKQKHRIGFLERDYHLIEKWIHLEAAWADEVTAMLRNVNWSLLEDVFDPSGGTNPPQTPPAWPPK